MGITQHSELKTQNSRAAWAAFSRPGGLMLVASLGMFLAALDQTVVVTALPLISSDLQIPATELDKIAWVVTAYLLGYTVALPLMGRVADVYGQRRIYLLSLGLFMLGSLLCALAPSLPWLVSARALQAVGGGAVLPVGLGMARQLYGERRLPFVLGMLGAVAEAGGVIGPLWGAGVIQGLDGVLGVQGWRWIFWVNIPLGLLFAALMFFTPRLPRTPGRIDWVGAALLGGGLLTLSLGLSTPGSAGALLGVRPSENVSSSPLVTPQGLALVGVSLVLFGLFVAWQRRAPDPLMPVGLLAPRNRPFAAANLTNLLVGAALIITMVNVPLYVASVLDGTAEQGGLMLLRMTALIPVGAVAGGLLSTRLPYNLPAIAGLVASAGGFWLMSGWTATSADDPLTWLGLALNGFGFGLLLAPVTAAALGWGGEGNAALSASSVTLSRMIGMMVSLSAFTALGLRRFQELMSAHPAVILPNPGESAEAFARRQAEYIAFYKAASLEVYSAGFVVAGVICLVGIVFAVWLKRAPHQEL